nr:two-component response regulator ARR-B family [Ipomoea batatas]
MESGNDSLKVLVVDDDSTCLAIVAALLVKMEFQGMVSWLFSILSGPFKFRAWSVYLPCFSGHFLRFDFGNSGRVPCTCRAIRGSIPQSAANLFSSTIFSPISVILVVALKNGNDAIEALRSQGGFDVVISDVHMPGMNGFELQQLIFKQFRIPVVLMSGDCEEGIVRQAMQNGAISFIRKPVSPNDLRGIWQYIIAQKRSKVTTEQVNTGDQDNVDIGGSSSGTGAHLYSGYDTTSKKKMVWTDKFHFIFLDAISSLGPENATPKNILKAMNVPGLTRENVGSHLQKYRQFLRRNIQDIENRNNGGGGNQPRFGSRKFRRLAKLEEMFAQGGLGAALSSAALGGSSAGGDARTRGGRGGSSERGQQGVLLSEDDESMFYRGLRRGPMITSPNESSPASHEVNPGGSQESSPYPTLTTLMQNRLDQYLDSSSNDNVNVSGFGNVNVVSGNEDVQVPGEGNFDIYDAILNFIGETEDGGDENISMYGNITTGQHNSGYNQIGNLSNDFLNQVNINQTYTPNQGDGDDDDDAFVNSLYGPNPYGGAAGNGEGM